MTGRVLDILEESRRREKAQTLFYRALEAEAEREGKTALAERFSALHADEQHHLSRLTARVLEMGGSPGQFPTKSLPPPPSLEGWEEDVRSREGEEVAWYQGVLEQALDPSTRDLIRTILESEVNHVRELGGKWMSA